MSKKLWWVYRYSSMARCDKIPYYSWIFLFLDINILLLVYTVIHNHNTMLKIVLAQEVGMH